MKISVNSLSTSQNIPFYVTPFEEGKPPAKVEDYSFSNEHSN